MLDLTPRPTPTPAAVYRLPDGSTVQIDGVPTIDDCHGFNPDYAVVMVDDMTADEVDDNEVARDLRDNARIDLVDLTDRLTIAFEAIRTIDRIMGS